MTVIIMKRRKAYNVVYTVPNENGTLERKYETFYDYQDALKRKKQIDGGKANEIVVDKNTLFMDFLNQYVNVIVFKNYAISQYEQMKSYVSNYISKVISDEKIKDIKIQKSKTILNEIKDLPGPQIRNQKKKDKICDSAIKGCYSLLCRASEYLVEQHLMDKNYFQEYRPPVTNKYNGSPEWNISYWNSFISNCADEKFFIFLHICFDTGLSISEVRAITVDNLKHLDEGYLISDKILRRINKNILSELNPSSILKIYPKAGFNNTNTVVVLRKKEREQKIKLHSRVVDLLMTWLNKQDKDIDGNALLYSMSNGMPYDDRVINRRFKEIKKKAKLPDITLTKLIRFGQTKTKEGITFSDLYYSSISKPLKCNEVTVEEMRRSMNSRHGTQYINKWKHEFNEGTSDYLPKDDHSDIDALINTLNANPEIKKELRKKLLMKGGI